MKLSLLTTAALTAVYIVEKYADLHQKMLFYPQENKGQGSARDNGLSLAKGKYIWFVDGDDYIFMYSGESLLLNYFQGKDRLT